MKPCDVKSYRDISKLEQQGIAIKSRKIGMDHNGVILMIEPYCRVKFDHRVFKRFAEWYLADQGDHKEDK
jgi:hypothetical protein